MKKETKVISILASAIFTISLLVMFIPWGKTEAFADRDDEFSDYYYGNTAYMFGFGSATTSISFEFLEGETTLDEEMFNFLKDAYNKFEYIDELGSVTSSDLSINNTYDINNSELNTRVEINSELHDILMNTKRLHEISNGIFDVTAGLMFDEVDNYIKGVEATYDVVQYSTGFNQDFDDRLLLEEVDSKYYATRTHIDTKVNLGGYLKGYFTEYVRASAATYFDEPREVYVNSGSSSMTYLGTGIKEMTIGSPRNGITCSVVGDPGCPGKWINQTNWHLATSGDYVQYKMDGDLRVHHLVDPRDGSFVQDRGMTSVLSNDYASYLDALSSIIFIADPSEYQGILDQLDQDVDVVYLTVNDTQTDFDVDYIQSTSETKFEIGSRYLPREVV